MRILIVVVVYQNFHFSQEWLSTARNKNLDIIIVDNTKETIFSKELSLECKKSGISILHNPKNSGYMPSLKYLNESGIRLSVYDFVCLSNSDVKLDDNFAHDLSLTHIPSEALVLGPKIVSLRTGSNQNPQILHRPTLKYYKLLKLVLTSSALAYPYFFLGKIKGMLSRENRKVSKCTEVYAVHGSFIIFKSICFEIPNFLDGFNFLFGETVIIAEKLRRAGGKCVVLEKPIVFHKEHENTGFWGRSKTFALQRHSTERIIEEFYK